MGSSGNKRGNRISSLFSLGSDSPPGTLKKSPTIQPSPVPSDVYSRGRGPHDRLRHSLPTNSLLIPPALAGNYESNERSVTGPMADLTLAPPPVFANELPGSPGSRGTSPSRGAPVNRATSPAPLGSRPNSLGGIRPGTPPGGAKRRSWLPGRSRNPSQEVTPNLNQPRAWVSAGDTKLHYDVTALETSQKAPDLWNEYGDTYVHLFPKASRKAPCFKIDSSVIASSATLTFLAHGGIYSSGTRHSADSGRPGNRAISGEMMLNVPVSPPMTPELEAQGRGSSKTSSQGSRTTMDSLDGPTKETHLYFPSELSTENHYGGPMEPVLSEEDVDKLVSIRNLFAFLTRQPLVETLNQPDYFSVFMRIAELLKKLDFGNLDGTNFGETAASNFEFFVHEFGLSDVRASREKTIEAIILGERLRCAELYNEGFVHGVGKYEDILKYDSAKYPLISAITRKRMERAALDLDIRLKSVRTRLTDFEFPSLFAGLANSTSLPEAKKTDFKTWKGSFIAMRKHTIAYYKAQYGSWPPKANSKKNDFEESGLNRILLKNIYHDFSTLYDLLVDRSSMTTRTLDFDNAESSPVRKVLSEYDRSSPPVQPPMPFDTPLLPYRPAEDTKKAKKDGSRKPKDPELDQALNASYNAEYMHTMPFLDAYRLFERRAGHGHTNFEITDQRIGHWLFLYCVLQSLPMLIVDAPGVRWSHGVEYFLCEPPKGGVPWAREGPRTSWYGIAGGQMVNLPSELVEHGVESIYQRSHPWLRAAQWAPLPPQPESPVEASYGGRGRRADSIGLEALPLPSGVAPGSRSRATSISRYDPTKSFDDILGKR